MKAEYSISGGAYSRFEYGIKSEETRRKYVRRLELFFDYCKFEGQTVKERAEDFLRYTKDNDMEKTTDLILSYMLYHINRAAKKIYQNLQFEIFTNQLNYFVI